jgi:hypothetical protein
VGEEDAAKMAKTKRTMEEISMQLPVVKRTLMPVIRAMLQTIHPQWCKLRTQVAAVAMDTLLVEEGDLLAEVEDVDGRSLEELTLSA